MMEINFKEKKILKEGTKEGLKLKEKETS